MPSEDRYPPSVPVARLYERTSKNGRTYLSGRMGLAKVVLLKTGEVTDDGCGIWQLLVSEAPQKADGEQRETRTVVRDPPSDGEQIAARNAQRRNRYPNRDTEPDREDVIPF